MWKRYKIRLCCFSLFYTVFVHLGNVTFCRDLRLQTRLRFVLKRNNRNLNASECKYKLIKIASSKETLAVTCNHKEQLFSRQCHLCNRKSIWGKIPMKHYRKWLNILNSILYYCSRCNVAHNVQCNIFKMTSKSINRIDRWILSYLLLIPF